MGGTDPMISNAMNSGLGGQSERFVRTTGVAA